VLFQSQLTNKGIIGKYSVFFDLKVTTEFALLYTIYHVEKQLLLMEFCLSVLFLNPRKL